ncbi:MAG: hypothetical protein ACI4NP_02660 [Thermoguttaceae bacterium]
MAVVKEIKRKTCTAYQVEYREGGMRRYLSLGSLYGKRAAEEIAGYVEKILTARLTGTPVDVRTSTWLFGDS